MSNPFRLPAKFRLGAAQHDQLFRFPYGSGKADSEKFADFLQFLLSRLKTTDAETECRVTRFFPGKNQRCSCTELAETYSEQSVVTVLHRFLGAEVSCDQEQCCEADVDGKKNEESRAVVVEERGRVEEHLWYLRAWEYRFALRSEAADLHPAVVLKRVAKLRRRLRSRSRYYGDGKATSQGRRIRKERLISTRMVGSSCQDGDGMSGSVDAMAKSDPSTTPQRRRSRVQLRPRNENPNPLVRTKTNKADPWPRSLERSLLAKWLLLQRNESGCTDEEDLPEKYLNYGSSWYVPWQKYVDRGTARILDLLNEWVFVGDAGTQTPWHVDPVGTGAWLYLVCGVKEWEISRARGPPQRERPRGGPHAADGDEGEEEVCSLGGGSSSSSDEMNNDGILPPVEVLRWTQQANEMVYVPAGWWHRAVNRTKTAAISHNFLSDENLFLNLVNLKVKKESQDDIPLLLGARQGLLEKWKKCNSC